MLPEKPGAGFLLPRRFFTVDIITWKYDKSMKKPVSFFKQSQNKL